MNSFVLSLLGDCRMRVVHPRHCQCSDVCVIRRSGFRSLVRRTCK